MRHEGTYTDLEIDIDEVDGDVVEAIVTDSRIAIDWDEAGERLHALMSSLDGIEYIGTFGDPVLNPAWNMEGTKYSTRDGSIFFLAKWSRGDEDGGSCYFELEAV